MFHPLMRLIYFSINLSTKDVANFNVNQTKTSSYSYSYKRLFSILLAKVVSFISYHVDNGHNAGTMFDVIRNRQHSSKGYRMNVKRFVHVKTKEDLQPI